MKLSVNTKELKEKDFSSVVLNRGYKPGSLNRRMSLLEYKRLRQSVDKLPEKAKLFEPSRRPINTYTLLLDTENFEVEAYTKGEARAKAKARQNNHRLKKGVLCIAT